MSLWALLSLISAGVPLVISLLQGKEFGGVGLLIGVLTGGIVGIVSFLALQRGSSFVIQRQRAKANKDALPIKERTYALLYLGALLWIAISGAFAFCITPWICLRFGLR